MQKLLNTMSLLAKTWGWGSENCSGPRNEPGQSNYYEEKGLVVMEMASIDVKIRHVFGATCFRPAAPPVIGKLSVINDPPQNQRPAKKPRHN